MPYQIVKRLPAGLTNKIYLTTDNQVLRLSRFTKELFLDRANEINVIKTLQASTFVNYLPINDYGYQNNKFFITTDYQPDLINLSKVGFSKSNIIRCQELIQKLHNIEVHPDKWPIKTFNYLDFLASIQQNIQHCPFQFHGKQEILDAIGKLGQRPLVLSHNDLSINNIVFINNRMFIIDYEYTQLNDPLYDVAAFISETLTTEKDVQTWLQSWKLDVEDVETTWKWMRFQNYLNTHWAWLMYEQTGSAVFKQIAEIQYKRFQKPYALIKLWKEIQPLL